MELIKTGMPVIGGEAIPLTPKSGLPNCNGLLSALTSRSKVYSGKQGRTLRQKRE
jgi:hypothetical protein